MTPSEIELATLRFVAQCLNRLRHRVPLDVKVSRTFSLIFKGLIKYLLPFVEVLFGFAD
jgi:hypothetical protein